MSKQKQWWPVLRVFGLAISPGGVWIVWNVKQVNSFNTYYRLGIFWPFVVRVKPRKYIIGNGGGYVFYNKTVNALDGIKKRGSNSQ